MRILGLLLFTAAACMGQTSSLPGIWERRALFPIRATEVSSAALNGRIYSLCGITATGNAEGLYVYDPAADSWSHAASLPISGGADHCNVAAANGKLYLLGAIRIGSSFIEGNTYEYDPSLDRWRMVARMGTPRGASAVTAIGSRIYVAGGLAQSGSVSDFEVFDTATLSWSRLPAMPTARDHLTAQSVNGKVYAIAGRASGDLAVNEEFDPVTTQWRARAPIARARGGLASGVLAGRLIVFGGEGSSGTPQGTFRDNDAYD